MKFRHIFLIGVVVLSLGATFVASASARPLSGTQIGPGTPDLIDRWLQRQTPNAPDLVQRYVQRQPAASFYTPAALKAYGLRMQAMARTYQASSVGTSSNGFDIRDALIGAAGGIGVAISAAGLLIALTRMRRPQVAL